MGRHNRDLPPPWHCYWEPILEVFVEFDEDLTVYDELVEDTEKHSSEQYDEFDVVLDQTPGSVVE